MSMRVPVGLHELAQYLQRERAEQENLVFSPCSIQLALSLLANGSKGKTLKELLTFLEVKDLHHLNLVATEGIDSLMGNGGNLSLVSGVWVDQSFTLNPSFHITAEETYKAKAQAVDFGNEAKKIVSDVNKWAAEASNGLIKSILPDNLDPLTRFILANALYFKGTWTHKFDQLYTREYYFYVPNGNVVSVPFMASCEDQFISTFDDFMVLKLPYESSTNPKSSLSMYIILPNEKNGLWSLLEKMGSDPSFLETCVTPYWKKLEVGEFRLPKFRMTCEFEVSKILANLGLKSSFSNEAEFDEMVHGRGLKVSEIFHKSCIEINEEGTEAAAITAVTAVPMCWSPTVDFVADHPFLFIVRDDASGMVLFMGHVTNPLS